MWISRAIPAHTILAWVVLNLAFSNQVRVFALVLHQNLI